MPNELHYIPIENSTIYRKFSSNNSGDVLLGLNILKAKRELVDQIVNEAKTYLIEVSDQVKAGIDIAETVVKKLAVELGIPDYLLSHPSVLVVQSGFNKRLNELRLIKPSCEVVGGKAFAQLNLILLVPEADQNKRYPEDIVASNYFHELIHIWIDLSVARWNYDSGSNEYSISDKRTGLNISRENDTPETEGDSTINEIPNFGLQVGFEKILRRQSEELNDKRLLLLQTFCNRTDAGLSFPFERITIQGKVNDTEFEISVSQDALFLFDDGNPVWFPTVVRQVYLEIEDAVDSISGENGRLKTLWLKAKQDPRTQKELMKQIDLVFGRGFYRILKHIPFDLEHMVKLLNRIQDQSPVT